MPKRDITISREEFLAVLARHPWIADVDRYAYLSRGWASLVEALLASLDPIFGTEPDVTAAISSKERFGLLRLHLRLNIKSEVLWRQVQPLVRAAEHASGSVCEVCGSPSELQPDLSWARVRCRAHA